MLTIKKSEPSSMPAAQPSTPSISAGAGSMRSTIGAGLTITGNLVSTGELQIAGTIQGDIQGVHILIVDTARITGAITGQDVIVHGVVMGSIRSERVVLAASCKVEGDVFHEALTIEQGAYFEGKSRRGGSAVGSAGANLDYPPYQSNT